MPSVKELRDHRDALKLHFESVMEELRFYMDHKLDPQLKPFVEDRIREFDQARAAFKDVLAEV